MKISFLNLVAIVITTLLAGCVSNVVPAGPDTYYISAGPLPIWMSAANAKADCYQQASTWCQHRGLVMVPVTSNEQPPIPGRAGSAELTFHAVKPIALNENHQ